MCDPGAVEAVAGLAQLVVPHARERRLVHLGIAPRRDERRHAADRVRLVPVARPDEQLGVRPHERHRHRHLRAVGQHGPELLDRAEDVVPPARVERAAVVAQLVEDRLHLERRRDRLDQHRAADRAARDAERLLRVRERPRPERRLLVALELRQIEVRAAPALQLLARVVEEREPEVEERGRDRRAVDGVVPLLQVPAARTHLERRDLVVQRVALLRRLERDLAPDGVGEVALPLDHVRPRRRARILEVAHEDPRPRVEGVDHHLAVGRAGDLAAPVLQVGRGRCDLPSLLGRRDELEPRAARELTSPLVAAAQQLQAGRVQGAMEALDEVESLPRQNLVDRVKRRHARDSRPHACSNCSASVDPSSASVEDSPPLTIVATRSK